MPGHTKPKKSPSAPKKDPVAPKKELPKKATSPLKKDDPKKDPPKKDAPKKDTEKEDDPEKDDPTKADPKKDTPKKDAPKKDDPKKKIFTDTSGTKPTLDPLPARPTSGVADPAIVKKPSSTRAKGADELTEAEWEVVINKTLITHGFEASGGVISRAISPAFRFKPRAKEIYVDHEGHPLPEVSSIPGYQVFDQPYFSTIEIKTHFHRSLFDHSFRSTSLEASFELAGIVGLSAAYNEEVTESKKTTSTTFTAEMLVSYNLPRTKIILRPELLEVSDDCAAAIAAIRTATHPKERRNLLKAFYTTYGKLFSTVVHLGGSLQSVKTSKSVTGSTTEEKTAAMKASATASIKSPKGSASGGAGHEKINTTGGLADTGKSVESLVWSATGGDPSMFSNPAAWIPTVNDFYNWRVIDRTNNLDILEVLESIKGYKDVPYHLRALSDAEETKMMEAEVERSKRAISEDLRRALELRDLEIQQSARSGE